MWKVNFEAHTAIRMKREEKLPLWISVAKYGERLEISDQIKTSCKHLTSSTFAAVFAEVSMKMRPCSRAKASPWEKNKQ